MTLLKHQSDQLLVHLLYSDRGAVSAVADEAEDDSEGELCWSVVVSP